MESSKNYRRFHESSMANINGTTAIETYSLFLPTFVNLFISTCLLFAILPVLNIKVSKLTQFFVEFIIMVFSIILWLTILSNYVWFFLIGLFIVAIGMVVWLRPYMSRVDTDKVIISATRRHFITNSRSTISLITVICILAVDFRIFPRRFAKTEEFGFSLMDVGVGLFLLANGFVTRLPTGKPSSTIYKTFIGCTPLLILGSIRFVLTKELDYQSQVSEYGVHWNFFITLAVTRMLSALLFTSFKPKYLPHITIALLIFQQMVLSYGIQDWVLSDVKRDNFIVANREGIVSIPGVIALYLSAFQVALFMDLKERITFKSNVKLFIELGILSVLTLIATIYSEKIFGISRRLANTAYTFWILFIGISMTMLFLGVELLMTYIQHSLKPYCDRNRIHLSFDTATSMIYEAINFNGLTFFLLGNVLTGLINLTIKTLYVDTVTSLIIVSSYTFLILSCMSGAYLQNIKLKFW